MVTPDGPDAQRPCTHCRYCSWPSMATGAPELLEVTATCSHPNVASLVAHVTGRTAAAPCLMIRNFGGCEEDGLWWDEMPGEPGA